MAVEETDGGVTFVNGHAASQQTEGETAQPADERSAAIAAVKEAMEAEGKSAAKKAKEADEQDPLRPRDNTERDADGKFIKSGKKDAEPEKAAAAPEEDAESLKAVLRQRKQIAQVKAQQAQEAQKAAQEIRQLRAEIEAERREVQAEKARFAALRSDPARAIREIGYEPEEFILDLARENTPEGLQARQQRALADQLKELHNWKAEQAAERERAQQAQQQQQTVQYRRDVERAFIGVAMDEAKYPHLGMYKGHEMGLLAEADVVAEQYRNLTGKEASFADVAEYIEERTANWYKTMSSRQGTQSTPSKAPVTQGKPTPGNATGRTLSSEDASERRALGTSIRDLDGDERLAAAREAVGAAFRHSGERT